MPVEKSVELPYRVSIAHKRDKITNVSPDENAMANRKESTVKFGVARDIHPYAWLWEPIVDEPTFVLRAMFGSKAVYMHGLMMLCFSAEDEPWRGLLVCTDQSRQPGLVADFPSLRPHTVLPKWLYLPESCDDFESSAVKIVRLAKAGDPRIGVLPGTRKRKAAPYGKTSLKGVSHTQKSRRKIARSRDR